MMFIILWMFILLQCTNNLALSSYPYISGDTFRSIANHIYDERNTSFNPALVKPKDVIFVKSDYIEQFFNTFHNHIPNPYILITHNSDDAIPGRCKHYLDDPKLIVWFGQNMQAVHHPKLHALPIGLANRYWPHGDIALVKKIIAQYSPTFLTKKLDRQLVYMNLTVDSNMNARKIVYDLFHSKPFCFNAPRKNFEKYLVEMAQYLFVFSPEGNGLDCHRTWEALYMGCIPIVKSHSLNELYTDLPVLIVDNWHEINEDFLRAHYGKMKQQNYRMEKLYAEYWFNKINEYKK